MIYEAIRMIHPRHWKNILYYYFDFVLKICSEEIDRKFPDGWGLSFDYRIPGECTNREQRRLKKMHGTEIIKWLLYADDLVLFCPNLSQAQDIIIIMNSVCKRFGLTISFKKTKVMQFSTDTLDISIKVGDIVLDNVKGTYSSHWFVYKFSCWAASPNILIE